MDPCRNGSSSPPSPALAVFGVEAVQDLGTVHVSTSQSVLTGGHRRAAHLTLQVRWQTLLGTQLGS